MHTSDGVAVIETSNLLFIAVAFGLSLIVNIWIFFRVSGGLFNPAITLALAIAQVIKPIRAISLAVSQILAGITAAALISVLTPGPLLVSTRLGGGTSISQGFFHSLQLKSIGLFLEMFLTAQLILMVFMLAVEKHKSTFLAPVGIGLTLFAAHLVGIYYTGAGLNPARSFGPDVVIRDFPGYHWIYCKMDMLTKLILGVGPFLGSLVSTGFYRLLKALNYQEVNGTQDRDDTMVITKAQVLGPPSPMVRSNQHVPGTVMHLDTDEGQRVETIGEIKTLQKGGDTGKVV